MPAKAWRWLEDYAKARERLVIGLISGTSADGVDAALVKIIGVKPKQVETVGFITLPYPDEIREAVLQISHDGDIETLCWLNFTLGEIFAEAALKVVKVAGVRMREVSLIGSHGQTVRHLPPKSPPLVPFRWDTPDRFARSYRFADWHSCRQRFSLKGHGSGWARCTFGSTR